MILQPRRNVWRIARSGRMAVLIDAAAYFRAVREALLKARHSVFIVGWDIHSQTRLVGESGEADDGYPPLFADFLSAIVKERPGLVVSLLLWDYSVLYAAERELFPTLTLRWNTPSRVRFCLDDAVPIGSSQHQKLIVVDDAVAFSGGLDVTIRRWDTSDHEPKDRRRVDPAGKPYRPFHDVQAIVDGEAARALAEIARARWQCACGETDPMVETQSDPWPDSVVPDFVGTDVGIARTQPAYEDQEEVREVEKLFLDMIPTARFSIYIENQFITCMPIARQLGRALQERPGLEALIVAPGSHESWLEAHSMRNGRIRFMQCLAEAGVADRVRFLAPQVSADGRAVDTMVHSKVMVIDDRVLRIGSANLNNRSMGTDTECDLVIESDAEEGRRRIVDVRNRLLADHCGVTATEVADAVGRSGSLLAAAESLSGRGHRLRRIEDGEPDNGNLVGYVEGIADPERPIGAEEMVSTMLGGAVAKRHASSVVKVLAAAAVLLALALAWRFTPLAELTDMDSVQATLADVADGPWAPLAVLGIFVAGGLVLFPVTVLIAATAIAFGPYLGFVYAASGALASALVTYAVGARLGRESLRDVLGPRLNRIRERLVRKGVIAVAAVRLVPVAPFTVVNLVAGASQIRLADYVVGTMLGLAPGLIVMSALGHRVSRILSHPTTTDYLLLVGIVVAWIAVSVGVQALVSKRWSADP